MRWDTPIKHTMREQWYTNPTTKVRTHTGTETFVELDGPAAKPPPYRGNGIVVKEGFTYLSADDHRMVMHRFIWDGESYRGGYEPFCTLRCALDYARRAYAKRRSPNA